METNKDFWVERYQTNDTGWDLGAVSPPIKEYVDKIKDKNIKILIPGCGNSYEAEYLANSGFKNVYVIDIAKIPLDNLKTRCKNIKRENLFCEDFFSHNGKYDLIIEQTFFCALNPSLREKYVEKMHELLSENGKLVGLFFGVPKNSDKPPYGGNKEEYENLFLEKFEIIKLEECYNSIKPRQGSELFFIFKKK